MLTCFLLKKPPCHLFVLCALLIFTTNLLAQTMVQGFVQDKDGKPITQANVLLLAYKDSALVKGALSSNSGLYRFENIPPGKYMVSATFTGLKQTFTPAFIIADKEEIELATLQMTEKEVELNAVTVSARKPLFEQKIDRMIINVAASITSTGSTALDVLMRSPGIIVDQQNNTLSMSGKEGVVVMLNGKISRMPVSAVVQMLAGMNANNIERIELITELDVYQNVDPRNNYFRIEEFIFGNISFVDGVGSNTGYFKLENLYAGSTTAAHEYGHTLGLDHPDLLDIRGQGIPGIMYPRGTLVDPAFQYNPTKPAGVTGGTMHPMHRRVHWNDIVDLKLHKLKFYNGRAVVGEFTNIYHWNHAEQ